MASCCKTLLVLVDFFNMGINSCIRVSVNETQTWHLSNWNTCTFFHMKVHIKPLLWSSTLEWHQNTTRFSMFNVKLENSRIRRDGKCGQVKKKRGANKRHSLSFSTGRGNTSPGRARVLLTAALHGVSSISLMCMSPLRSELSPSNENVIAGLYTSDPLYSRSPKHSHLHSLTLTLILTLTLTLIFTLTLTLTLAHANTKIHSR